MKEEKKMDKEHHKYHNHSQGGGFSNGFLLGAIVGSGLVFLLGTKKGKQVLKTLMENGFEGVSELQDLLNDDEDDAIVDEYVQDAEVAAETSINESPKPSKSIKRFFKRRKK